MSRITGVTLLFVILVVSFYHSTASQRPKLPIHECGCTVLFDGKTPCLKHKKPTSIDQIEDLGKCLCSKPDHHKKFKTACEWFRKFTESNGSHIPSTPL